MDFREMQADEGNLVKGYGPGEVRINEERFTDSVVVFKHGLWQDWLPTRYSELAAHHLEPLAAEGIEVLLLGTGDRLQFPDPAITGALINQGVGVEAMDTPAACRTYNILMSEDRIVAAALFLTEEAG
jgi:uncharacterized protein